MKSSEVFQVLGIEETRDENMLREAYRKKLLTVNPEDDAAGFVRLREAYEEAIRLAKVSEDVEWATDTPVGAWTQKLDNIYLDLSRRIRVDSWEGLFEDAYFRDLDTEDDAKNALLAYLTRHYYLPSDIWTCIADACDIEKQIDTYAESFPRDFLRYILDSRTVVFALPFDLFEGPPTGDYDLFINNYFSLRNMIADERDSSPESLFDLLEQSDIQHPFVAAERIRNAIKSQDRISIRQNMDLFDSVLESNSHPYIRNSVAKAYWALGDYDKAENCAKATNDSYPDDFDSRKILADYQSLNKEYEKAHESYLEIIENYQNDKALHVAFINNLKAMIAYKKARYTDSASDSERIELCWNYYQDGDAEKALKELLRINPETDEDKYSYVNLISRLYIINEKYKEAFPQLETWKEYVDSAIDDGSKEMKRRIRRRGTVRYLIAEAWLGYAMKSNDVKSFDNAMTYYDRAIGIEESASKIEYMQRRANGLIYAGRYEECVDYCTTQINDVGPYLPFYLIRQKAYYYLGFGQEVINEFYAILPKADNVPSTYGFTADVFLKSGQYQEAQEILDKAKTAGLESPRLQLVDITLRRYKATTRKEIEDILVELNGLFIKCKKLTPQNSDIDDLSNIKIQICYGNMDIQQYDIADGICCELMTKFPDNAIYVRVRADIFAQTNSFVKAESILKSYLKKHPDASGIWMALAEIYTQSQQFDNAINAYMRSRKLLPDYYVPPLSICKLYLQKNNAIAKSEYLEKSLELLDEQIEKVDEAELYFQRGITYLDMDMLKEAISDFEHALEASPDKAGLINRYIGDAYRYINDFDKAEHYYLEAKDKYGDTVDYLAYINLALLYESNHMYDEAINIYRQMIKAHPDWLNPYYDMASVYIKKKEYENALSCYDFVLEWSDTTFRRAKAYSQMVNCYLKMGKIWSARKTLKKLPFMYSMMPSYYVSYGDYYRYLRLPLGLSLIYYKKAYLKSREIDGVWEAEKLHAPRLLSIYQKQNKPIKIEGISKRYFEELKKQYQDISGYINNPAERKQRLFSVGCVCYYSGRTEEARAYFDQMDTGKNCSNCPYVKCVESMVGHAMLLEGEGRLDEAIVLYEEAVAEGYESSHYSPQKRIIKKKVKKNS